MNFGQPFPEEKMTPELRHYKTFLENHLPQLSRIEFPRDLYANLYRKLKDDVRDAGTYFLFDTTRKHTMNENLEPLVAIKDIKKEEDVFLVDHIYSTLERDMERQIEKIEKVRNLCVQLMRLDLEAESGSKKPVTIKKDNAKSDTLSKEVSEVIGGKKLTIRGGVDKIIEEIDMKDVVVLDLRYNNFEDLASLGALTSQNNSDQMLAIDLRFNPVAFDVEELKKMFPNAQLINGYLQENYTEWAFCHLANVDSVEKIKKLSLTNCDIKLWKEEIFAMLTHCTEIHMKGNEITEETIQVLKVVPILRELFTNWEYHRMIHSSISTHLKQVKKVNYVFINTFEVARENKLAAAFIKENIWKFVETYTIQSITYDPVWYLMDAVGLAIDHGSRVSNFKIAPFQFIDSEEFFTLMWPINDVKEGEKITRDYAYESSDIFRTIKNLIWHPDMELPEASKDSLSQAYGGTFVNPKKKSAFDKKPEPIAKFSKDPIYVCCDSRLVRESILADHANKKKKSPSYELVSLFSEADILWIVHDHYTNPIEELPKQQFINQFQYDHNLTSKPYFLQNARGKSWDIQSYFLGDEEQTYSFVQEYRRRKEAGEHNVWIAKPSNLTRSQAIVVSDNLATILKWMNTPGDIVVSIYLENPALFRKRKFDLRFMLLVDSIYPDVKLYLYDQFKVRLSSEDYALNDLSSFKKHFTVQQYVNGPQVDIPCAMFIREWNLENPEIPFETIFKEICKDIRELIESVQDKISDDNHLASPHSKALYGIDIIIDNSTGNYVPKILECNFSPDATYFQSLQGRNFYREVFDTLFTTQAVSKTMIEI